MSNEQGFVSASDFEEWKRQRDSTAAHQQAQYARIAAPFGGLNHASHAEAAAKAEEEIFRMGATHATGRSGVLGLGSIEAQMSGQPKDRLIRQTFTRAEILTSLRAILASKGGLYEAIVAFENLE